MINYEPISRISGLYKQEIDLIYESGFTIEFEMDTINYQNRNYKFQHNNIPFFRIIKNANRTSGMTGTIHSHNIDVTREVMNIV